MGGGQREARCPPVVFEEYDLDPEARAPGRAQRRGPALRAQHELPSSSA